MPEVASFPPRPPEPGPDAPTAPTTREAAGRTAARGAVPRAPAALDPSRPETFDRRALSEAARLNNQDFVQALRREPTLTAPALKHMPVSMYDESYLRDAWGSPIVFMPTMHPLVGTAPRDRSFFFFSAGPDREYLTQEDNLYSYEERVSGVK